MKPLSLALVALLYIPPDILGADYSGIGSKLEIVIREEMRDWGRDGGERANVRVGDETRGETALLELANMVFARRPE